MLRGPTVGESNAPQAVPRRSDVKPTGQASWEKDCREKESENSETEINSICNITLTVTVSFVMKVLARELRGTLISEEPV